MGWSHLPGEGGSDVDERGHRCRPGMGTRVRKGEEIKRKGWERGKPSPVESAII